MAEGLFNHLADLRRYRAISAGVAAAEGMAASPNAVRVMAEAGVDISSHRSRPMTEELARRADMILGMTQAHVETIRALYPHAAEKTFLLREFDESLAEWERGIPDPIGGSMELYRDCRDAIQNAILDLLRHLERMEHQNNAQESRPLRRAAIGSDHAGYQLKEALRRGLEREGLAVRDEGAYSADSTDYPDYAKAVCARVLSGEADFGLLICSTGIGMSIAANKMAGIRAALTRDEEDARLARSHNQANVLCFAARHTSAEEALGMVRAFLAARFEGGRHLRRVRKIEPADGKLKLAAADPELFKAVEAERNRQQENIELIASENFTSPAVMEAQGSTLTNKYAEGYPRKRWYGGCEFVDVAEQLAIDRAKELFGAEHVNVQPHSGSAANMAVYFAVLQPGDRILTMDLSHGGHLTHGHKANFSGRFFEVIHYGVDKETERIDYDHLAQLARAHRPKMITVGASAYPRVIDFERMGEIAREVGAYLLADIAHIAGLVAVGLHPSPVPHADFVTTTTHKTLRGPRGGLILCKAQYAKQIDSQVFPGIQGGPLMHVIAAKAVCLHEALQPQFKTYQEQILRNAKELAQALASRGYRLVSGGTDNHLMLVDVGARGWTGKQCQEALDRAGITVNKNTIPFETRSPFQASGIRLGSPAVTTRGMKEEQMRQIAEWIDKVLNHMDDLDIAAEVRQAVRELTVQFPLPY